MNDNERPMANSNVVLREEFDDWAVLFDPDTGEAFGMNPLSVFIWKQINGKNSLADIMGKVSQSCDDVPSDAREHIARFMDQLVAKGLIGYEIEKERGE